MIWALALLLVSTARADFTVTDSSQVLSHMMGAQTGQPFSSVQCGQTTTAESPVPNCKISCTDTYCTSECDDQNTSSPVTFQLTVADCSASQFSIYGNNGLSIAVSADEYAANGNTWLLPFLRSAGFFISPDGQAQIESMYFQNAQFVGGGKITPIMPWILTGTMVFPGAKMGLGFELWFDPQFSGAEQVLMFRLNNEVLYQLRGLILGPNQ